MKNYLLKLLCFLIVVLCSCKKDKVSISNQDFSNQDCLDTISYSQQIQPLLSQNCATSYCHGGGSNGYDLSNHASVSANASIILSAIKHEPGFVPMPYPPGSSKLPDSLINYFQCWFDQGMLNN